MNLIIVKQQDQIEENIYKLDGQRLWHLKNILKTQIGSSIEVGKLNGPRGNAKVIEMTHTHAILQCCFEINNYRTGSTPIVDIICALPRPQTLKDILQSAATMQIRNIHLINSNKVEVCYFNASVMSPQSIEEHLIKGLCQGKSTMLPAVHIHRRFKTFFSETLPGLEAEQTRNFQKILLDTSARMNITSESISDCPGFILAIGPEGGWTTFEIEYIKKFGFDTFRLGPWPLRVENALVAAVSQLHVASTTMSRHC